MQASHKRILALAGTLLLGLPAGAGAQGSLNSPYSRSLPPPSIGSELWRGVRVANDCYVRANPSNGETPYQQCIADAEFNSRVAHQSNDEAFDAGLYLGAWRILGVFETSKMDIMVKEHAQISSDRQVYWVEYNDTAWRIGVTDADIFAALGDAPYNDPFRKDVAYWRSHPSVACPPSAVWCASPAGPMVAQRP